MISKSIFVGIAGLATIATIVAGPLNEATANPLEFGGARLHLRAMPVVPTQPSVADAINANFHNVHFDITNDYDEDSPLQSRDDDEEDGDDSLDHLFGEEDPERTALVNELDRYTAYAAKARALRDKLANDFLATEAGTDAKEAIDEAKDDLEIDIESADRKYQRKMAAAAKREGKDFGKNSPGAKAAEAWLHDEIAELRTEFSELREAILEAEMMDNDPRVGARFVDLIDSINQTNEVIGVINQQIDAIDQAELENEAPVKPVEKAENTSGR